MLTYLFFSYLCIIHIFNIVFLIFQIEGQGSHVIDLNETVVGTQGSQAI